ncbi:MAG: XrtA/PEP-CTERM system-associated ATPase [Pseudomonadota bacterium]
MYEEYFGLSGAPFKLNPDPRFFYGARSHNKAMAYLHYGLKQAEGFIVVTGPVGSGKTMVISQLLNQLTQSNIVAAQILTTNIAPDELLEHILSAFRIEAQGTGRTATLEALEDYLLDQLRRGRRALLIVDEAQNLPFETLEELRMLSNIDYEGTPLLQVFLVGQPEFRETMSAPDMEQLRQRVIASCHLETLSEMETREYILHRLAVAGWRGKPEFTDKAFALIHQETQGRPRRINTVCNRIMLHCAMSEKAKASEDIVKAAIDELRAEERGAPPTAEVAPPPKVANVDKAKKTAKPKPNGAARSRARDASIFDRLQAQRVSEPPEPPAEATLEDVASAIAAVQSGAAPAKGEDGANSAPAPLIRPAGAGVNRRALIKRSIANARSDLKSAHETAGRLRKLLDEMQRRRRADHDAVLASIERAEELIGDIGKAGD